MGELDLGFYILLMLILGAEFTNGWTDAPNSIATVISTRVFSPLMAVIIAAIFNFIGVLSGTAVAHTIGTEIVDPAVINLTTLTSSMLAIIIWSVITARIGLPTSETHALVAGLGGAGVATAGFNALIWTGFKKILLGLLFSSLIGFIGGIVVMSAIYRIFQFVAPGKMRRSFHYLQMLSAIFMAFSHGSNDGQKFMGIFTLALVMGNVLPSFAIPLWVIALCASVMAIGTLSGGWRILKTMGFQITYLDTPQGFAAELVAASTIETASALGIPLSTTHTINTAIMGVGATRRFSAVRWGITNRIIAAWIFTFPACGLLGYAVAIFLKRIS